MNPGNTANGVCSPACRAGDPPTARRTATPKTFGVALRNFFAIIVFALVGCATQQTTYYVPMNGPFKSVRATVEEIDGHYKCDGGPGYFLALDLKPDRTYTATWFGCLAGLGPYGKSAGEWRLSQSRQEVIFAPSEESGMLKGHLTVLKVRKNPSERFVLLFPEATPWYFEKREVQEH